MTEDWCAETAMHKAVARGTTGHAPVRVYQYSEGEYIPESAWEDAMYKAIELVKDLGAEFGNETDFIELFSVTEQHYLNSKVQLSDIDRMNKIAEYKQGKASYLVAENSL